MQVGLTKSDSGSFLFLSADFMEDEMNFIKELRAGNLYLEFSSLGHIDNSVILSVKSKTVSEPTTVRSRK
jgi:hypothetical protein